MNLIKLMKNLKIIDYLFILIVIGLVVLQVYLDLKLPDFTGGIMTELGKIKYGIDVDLAVIWANGGLMLACAFGSLGSAILVRFCTAAISARLAYNVRAKVYNKIQGFSLAEINKFSTASLITRTTNDITHVQTFVSMGMQAMVKAPILAVWSVIKILNKSWQWSVAIGVAVGFLLLMVTVIVLFAVPKFKKIQTMTDDMNRITRENLTGIRVIRSANAEEYQNKKEKLEELKKGLMQKLLTGKIRVCKGD